MLKNGGLWGSVHPFRLHDQPLNSLPVVYYRKAGPLPLNLVVRKQAVALYSPGYEYSNH